MTLNDYWLRLNARQRTDFVGRCSTTSSYIDQIRGGHRQPSGKLAQALHVQSGYTITLHSLRPDLYPDPDYSMNPLDRRRGGCTTTSAI